MPKALITWFGLHKVIGSTRVLLGLNVVVYSVECGPDHERFEFGKPNSNNSL